jgi:hypothetical protein
MCLAPQANSSRALLDSLKRVFDLVQPTLGREDGVVRVVCIPELIDNKTISQSAKACAYRCGMVQTMIARVEEMQVFGGGERGRASWMQVARVSVQNASP